MIQGELSPAKVAEILKKHLEKEYGYPCKIELQVLMDLEAGESDYHEPVFNGIAFRVTTPS